MTITTFYFSGTGNSKWAAYKFQAFLIQKGINNNVFSIEKEINKLPDLIETTDGIAFIFPVYGMNIPENMKGFMRSLNKIKRSKGKKSLVFIITTFGYVDGCGPYEVMRHLDPRQFRLRGYTGLKMANNICTPASYNEPLTEEVFEKRLAIATAKIQKLASKISNGKRKIDFGMYFLVGPFRKKMAKIVENGFNKLSIDEKRCTKCMLCVNNCPVGAIVLKEGKLVITSRCVACMRCYNNCPTFSVLHGGQFADPKKYKRYKGPGL